MQYETRQKGGAAVEANTEMLEDSHSISGYNIDCGSAYRYNNVEALRRCGIWIYRHILTRIK